MLHKALMTEEDRRELAEIEQGVTDLKRRRDRLLNRLRQRAFRAKDRGN